METKSSLTKIVYAIVFTGLAITGCKKADSPAPISSVPAASVQPYTSAQQTQRANDQSNVENQCNAAMDDADNAMQNCARTRHSSAITVCNLSIDTSLASQGKITLNYNGNDCSNLTSRTGSIVIQLPYNNNTVTTWTTAGAVAKLTFNNYKVTRLSDNKSITYNGFHSIKNVNGGGALQLLSGATILHQIRANMVITFDNGTTCTWQIAKTRTFTNAAGLITATVAGDSTFSTYVHAAVWGTNRLGQPFTVDMPTAVSYYTLGSVSICLYRPFTGVVIDYVPSNTLTITYGVDFLGNPATGCPFGYKFAWMDANNVQQHIVLPYL